MAALLQACGNAPGKTEDKNTAAEKNDTAELEEKPAADLIRAAELELMAYSQKLYDRNNYDSAGKYSQLFAETLTRLVSENPGTMTYAFDSLRADSRCRMTTSPDGLLRLYSWDDGLGGTMRFYKNIYQYKLNGEIQTQVPALDEQDNGGFYSEIFVLDTTPSRQHYLAIFNGIGSNRDVYQAARIFTIDKDGLSDSTKLFELRGGVAK